DDLLAAVCPAQVACADNATGPIVIPDHPLVRETIDNCLHEAMDTQGLDGVLADIERGAIETRAVDTPAPSVLSHEILHSNPYTYLDDAPLEERRARAVALRRTDPDLAGGLGALDAAAIAAVRAEAWPDVRDADELHDTLSSLVLAPWPEVEAAGWGVVRAGPPRPHPPADARPPPARDRARLDRRSHALPLPLAARRGGDAAARPARPPRDHRAAPGGRACGARLGDSRAAGARR